MPAQNEAEQFSAEPANAPSRIGLSTFNATFNGMSSPVTVRLVILCSPAPPTVVSTSQMGGTLPRQVAFSHPTTRRLPTMPTWLFAFFLS